MQKMSSQAYDRLYEMIMCHTIQVGDIISHRRLATMLNMGKQSVSQALDILERSGIVESIPKVGTRVLPVTSEDLWGALQWRIAVERRSAFLAAQWIEPSQKSRLLEMSRALDAQILEPPEEMEISHRQQQETEFHLFIAECAHCKRLETELKDLDIYFLKLILNDLVRALRRNQRLVLHERIAEEIVMGHAEAAAELMQKHLEESPDMAGFSHWYVAERQKLRNKEV